MDNPDLKNKKDTELKQKMNQALKDGDEKAFAEAFTDFADSIQQSVLQEANQKIKGVVDTYDANVLIGRGTRQLTTEETKYYQTLIKAMKSSNPKQAIDNMDAAMPPTIIDDVFTDLQQNHPLLSTIDFQNSGAVTEWLLNENPKQLATWSALSSEIVKELTSGFKKINLTQDKLSAFLPVAKAMLDLGPQWLDRYVRQVLGEALALGLEDGILNGRGQTANLHEPIGMRKNLAGSIDQSTGYPDKAKTSLTSLEPVDYGKLLASLAKAENGNPRVVNDVIMVVNPTDYLTKVMPATTPRRADGTYASNVFPFPTTVVQSVVLNEGEAILGLGSRYLMAAGTGPSGKIDYSDEYRFLEDERVYLVKFYGHGQPKDNNAFLLLDISKLKPTVQQVYVTNAAEFPGTPEA